MRELDPDDAVALLETTAKQIKDLAHTRGLSAAEFLEDRAKRLDKHFRSRRH